MTAYLIVTLILAAGMFHMGSTWLRQSPFPNRAEAWKIRFVVGITLGSLALFAWGSWLLFHLFVP